MISPSRVPQTLALAMIAIGTLIQCCHAQDQSESENQAIANLLAGRFRWNVSQPLLGPLQRPDALTYAIKDPSIVFHEGRWIPVAATKDRSFASMANTRPIGERWTDSISHGELIRCGYDERLTVDPANLRFLFQRVSNKARAGKPYGQIPWRIGMLEQADDLK